jgi:hypothetical protein
MNDDLTPADLTYLRAAMDLARRSRREHGSNVRAARGMWVRFADVLPAGILLLCGMFGNVTDRDIQRTVQAAPALCQAGATVIWTRHRRPPDLTPQIRQWFAGSGFDEIAFDALETTALTSVGVSRLCRAPADKLPEHRLFTFRAA